MYSDFPLVSIVPLSNGFTASYTDKKRELFYKEWLWVLHYFLFTVKIHHCHAINVFLYQHGNKSLWVDGICSLTRDNMECNALLSNDSLPTTQKS